MPLQQRRNRSSVNIFATLEGALCIALCVVLERINIFAMPQGGSVDFELIPLMIFAYRRGFWNGIRAGFLAGAVKVLIGGYILYPLQVALDYPLAYAFVGFVAIRPRIIGVIFAAAGHTACSVLSGLLFFAEYASDGQDPLMYSIMYNVPVLGVKYLLSWIISMFMWKVLERELSRTV